MAEGLPLTQAGIEYQERLQEITNPDQRALLTSVYGYMLAVDKDANSLILCVDTLLQNRRANKMNLFDVYDQVRSDFGDQVTESPWVESIVRTRGKGGHSDVDRRVQVIELSIKPESTPYDYAHYLNSAFGNAIVASDLIFDITHGFKIEGLSQMIELNSPKGYYIANCLVDGNPAGLVVISNRCELTDQVLRQEGPRAAVESLISQHIETPTGASSFAVTFDRKTNYGQVDLPKKEGSTGKTADIAYVYAFPMIPNVPLPLHSAGYFADFIAQYITTYVIANKDTSYVPFEQAHLADLTNSQLAKIIEDTRKMEKHAARAHTKKVLSELGVDMSSD